MNDEIGPDLREISETIWFGLNMRQLISSVVGIVLAVMIWMLCRDRLGQQYTSWLCCAAVAPCACIGFVKVQGQPFERFALSWLKFAFLESKELPFRSNDINVKLLSKRREKLKVEEGDADENAEDVRKVG